MTKKNTARKPSESEARQDFDIIIAAKFGQSKDVFSALEEDPFCINKQNGAGLTALHWASANRDLTTVNLLLRHQRELANPWLEDSKGRKPINHAIDSACDAIVQILTERMFGPDKPEE